MTIQFNGELHCSLPVRDLDRAIHWYGDVLGFKMQSRMDAIGFAVLETSVPGVVLGLSTSTDRTPGPNGVNLVWGVTNVETARSSLEAQGVTLDGPINHIPGVVKLQGFFDPDGNRLTFWAPSDAAR
jgi:predicted enzyme related to lactoylglutathione lyase